MSAAIRTASPFPTIVSFLISEDGKVLCFQWKDYRRGGQQKPMTLNADEFIRRFLMHVLPSGFQRIRYYGLLGNRYRKDKARPLSRTSRHVEAGAPGR